MDKTGARVLCVSDTNASIIRVSKAWSTSIETSSGGEIHYLSHVAGFISSQQILQIMPASGKLLIHEPDPPLASIHIAYNEGRECNLHNM